MNKNHTDENPTSSANYPNDSNPVTENPNFQSSNPNDIAYPWGEYPGVYSNESDSNQNSHQSKNQSSNNQIQNENQNYSRGYDIKKHNPHTDIHPKGEYDVPYRKTPESEKPKSKAGLIALLVSLIVLLIAALAVVGYLILTDSNEDDIQTSKHISNTDSGKSSADDTDKSEAEVAEESTEVVEDSAEATDHEGDPEDKPKTKKESTYYAYKADVTWEQAATIAKNEGGHLVCINDYNEYLKVCRLAEENDIVCCWVGAKLSYHDYWNEVYWEDGTEFDVDYDLWHDMEPSYEDTKLNIKESYLMLSHWSAGWGYNDAPNNAADYLSPNVVGYIIEFEND